MAFMKTRSLAVAAGALALGLLAAQAAQAGERTRGWVGPRGASATRTATWGEGSVDLSRTRTGPQGASRTAWSTIYRSDDGFGRSRGASGSGGRSLSGGTDVKVGPESVTVDRSVTTGSGQTRSRTRVWRRR